MKWPPNAHVSHCGQSACISNEKVKLNIRAHY